MTHFRTLFLLVLLALTSSAQTARAEAGRVESPRLDHQGWTLIEVGGQPGRESQIGLKLEGTKARAAGGICFELVGPIERTQDALNLQQLKPRYLDWSKCRPEHHVLVDALHRAFRLTERYAIVGEELRLMSAASEVLARFRRNTNHVFGSRQWTMTEMAGQPAIRYSPTTLTFRGAGAHADDGCQNWDLQIDASEQERTVHLVDRKLLMKNRTPCPPALEVQAARLADALVKADRYEQTAEELRLLAGTEVLTRFAAFAPAWPESALAVGDATFWTAVEIAGEAVPADDRPTLNLVVNRVMGKAGACTYLADLRHGHGEIVFWNLAASKACSGTRVGALLTALARANTIEMARGALVLYSASGVVLARFAASVGPPVAAGTWRLIELAGERPRSVSIILTLPDGKLHGNVDCNRLSGRVRLGNGIIAFPAGGRIMSTLMGCPRPSNADFGIINHATRFQAAGDRLSFLDESGRVVARFARLSGSP